MNQKTIVENTIVSIRISKKLLAEFDEYAKIKGYQTRNKAILDLIKKEI